MFPYICLSLLQDSSMQEEGYAEPMDTTPQQVCAAGQSENAKLPPVLANLMGNMNSNSRSPQATNNTNNPIPPSVNVQELLQSIMVNIRYNSDESSSSFICPYMVC